MQSTIPLSRWAFRLAAALAAAPIINAATIDNPIPARIPKSDTQIELQPIGQGLASPLLVVAAPEPAGRLYVVDQPGFVRVIENGALRAEPFLDLSARVTKLNPDFDERGLLGLAFDPDFQKSGRPGYRRIFTYSSEPVSGPATFPNPHSKNVPANHQSSICAWRVKPDLSAVDVDTRQELLRIDQPQFNHNGGMIAFGPDGLLYIGLGDGGAANDLGPGHHPEIGNAQDKNVPLGKMLRIDVNAADGPGRTYGIPRDNPFVNGGGLREIFALGLRNPYRFSFDGATLLAGDVGQNKMEMLHRVERGGNYGWRLKEGTFKFNQNGSIEAPAGLPADLRDPVLQYDRDEGTSIIGGHVYRGRAIPALVGKYVFGDYRAGNSSNGRLFVGELANGEIRELRIGNVDRPLGFLLKGFGLDQEGELYICGSAKPGPLGNGGVVMKLIPAGNP